MVNLKYVQKRKRNKLTSIITAVSSIVVIAFVVIAFLGQKTGSYTISLKTSNVSLALSTSSTFENPTSLLRVYDLKPMNLYCFKNFDRDEEGNVDFTTIDNENNPYTIGARMNDNNEIVGFKYFKYTFFIKNVGTTIAHYDMDLNIVSEFNDRLTSKKSSTFLRAAVIQDGEYTIYALRSNDASHYDQDERDTSTLEYIDGNHDESKARYAGLAEPFVNSKKICSRQVDDFMPNQVIRYTMLFWLEGDDSDATGVAPEETKLRLGVEIQAYEN